MQEFIDKHFFNLFLFTLFFGVITYGLIGFQSIDEVCGVILFIMFLSYLFWTKDWLINRAFAYTMSAFLFYLCYSFFIGSNTKKAILVDFIIQLKPYLAFFCVYQLKPFFSKNQKTILHQLSIILWFILFPLGILEVSNNKILDLTMAHPSNFASAITALSMIFLFTSENTKKDRILFICMLALGIASGRSKFYGLFIVATFVAFYFSNLKNLKLNLKTVLILLSMVAIMVYVTQEKIALYFLQGIGSGETNNDLIARFVLYETSGQILVDYFPFGSGFGSFATHASRIYYSPIYEQYGIDGVWGLSRYYSSFIADTYYPSLAQFGFVGVFLFLFFWFYLVRKAYKFFRQTGDIALIILTIIITGYFAIENLADASFTSNRGFFFMMLLGVIFSEMKYKEKAFELESQAKEKPCR